MGFENKYLELMQECITKGKQKQNRTGITRHSIHNVSIKHNMDDGFPIVTTKKMAVKQIFVELEFFIKGLTDKKWLKDRGCHIWNEWANPKTVDKIIKNSVSIDDTTTRKAVQKICNNLGPIYGYQWRNYNGDSIDQFDKCIEGLKKNPCEARYIVSAWNPSQMNEMALPPCHYSFQFLSDGDTLDLVWNQRSADAPLGVPFNIASYAMLLLLVSKEVDLKAGELVGHFGDFHVYDNQTKGVIEQVYRTTFKLPKIEIKNWNGIYNWEYNDYELIDYNHHEGIKFPIAV